MYLFKGYYYFNSQQIFTLALNLFFSFFAGTKVNFFFNNQIFLKIVVNVYKKCIFEFKFSITE